MALIGRFFGVIFAIIWVTIWVVVVVNIIKTIKKQNQVREMTKDVFKVANDALRSVHTGNPHNPYKQPRKPEPANADNFSDIPERKKDSDSFNSDLNPKTAPQRVYRTKATVNGKRMRTDKVYAVNASERPAHGKLSKESRDDEKEWF